MTFSDNEYIFIYLTFFLVTFVFSFLINGLFLRFARTLGIRNSSDTIIRWGSKAKPAFGGIAFFIIFLLSIAVYFILFGREGIIHNKKLIGLLAATTLAFLMGLADDAYNTRPFLKFLVQVLCGLLLIASGTYMELFEQAWLNYIVTVIWVVGIMNAINMLDNMDAITTTVAMFITLTALCVALSYGNYSNISLILFTGLLSALTGFLFFNWHPSKMYMGDTGSQFLGVFLAAAGIDYFWNFSGGGSTKQLVIAVLAFILPLTDTLAVIINRASMRRSPFVGGKDHTTHYLAYAGMNDRQVALFFAGISIVSLLLILVIMHLVHTWTMMHFILFSLYFLVVFASLFRITRKHRRG